MTTKPRFAVAYAGWHDSRSAAPRSHVATLRYEAVPHPGLLAFRAIARGMGACIILATIAACAARIIGA